MCIQWTLSRILCIIYGVTYSDIVNDFCTKLCMFAIISLLWPRLFLSWRPFHTSLVQATQLFGLIVKESKRWLCYMNHECYDFHRYQFYDSDGCWLWYFCWLSWWAILTGHVSGTSHILIQMLTVTQLLTITLTIIRIYLRNNWNISAFQFVNMLQYTILHVRALCLHLAYTGPWLPPICLESWLCTRPTPGIHWSLIAYDVPSFLIVYTAYTWHTLVPDCLQCA